LRRPDGVLWVDPNAWDVPIFYLAFHGSPGSVHSVLEQIARMICAKPLPGMGAYPILFILDPAASLRVQGQKVRKGPSSCIGIEGGDRYKKDVNWMDSLVVRPSLFVPFLYEPTYLAEIG